MSTFEQRRTALEFAMRNVGDKADLSTIFAYADQFNAYLDGHKAQELRVWDTTRLIERKTCYDNPVAFAERFAIRHPAKGTIPFDPHPFQRDLIGFVARQRFTHINHARQMGVTTSISTVILWLALTQPHQCILLLAPRLVQGMETLERIRHGHDNLPEHLKLKYATNLKREIEFENGSRIMIGVVGSGFGKGLAPSAVFLEDFGHVSHKVAEEFMIDFMPVITSSKSRICMFGCPSDDQGMFAHIGQSVGKNGFLGRIIPWHEHPERDEAWAKPFRDALGERQFRREFECEYLAADKR